MAQAMESEAARRYRELAARMRLRAEEKLAALFEFLASIEDKHAAQVGSRAKDELGSARATPSVSWEVPENFDEEEGSSHLLTPYRALAVAVRNEERAFAFYSYVAAAMLDERSRTIAEELAKDELAHAWLLRRERRKAYRAEAGRHPAIALPSSIEELWAIAAETEWAAACYHGELIDVLAVKGARVAAFAEAAADERECAAEAAARLGRDLDRRAAAGEPTVAGGIRLLEAAFERYADFAERTTDEEVLRESQRLAGRAVRRLTLVRGWLASGPTGR